MKTVTYRFVPTICFLLLTACGGGGGGGSDSAPPPPPPPVDSTPPTVSSFSPAENETNIELEASITIQFDEDIDASSVSEVDFSLTQASSSIIGAFSFNSASNTITFTPAASLDHSLVYQVDLSGTITDLAGNMLGSNMTWTFTARDFRWSAPVEVRSSSNFIRKPSIVFGPNNSLIAYWVESESSTNNIWTSLYQDGQGWLSPQAIYEDVSDQSSSPQIATFSGSDTTWSFWASRNLTTNASIIQSGVLNNLDGSWSDPVTIEAPSRGPTRLRTSGDGTGMAFFVRFNGVNDSLYAHHISSGLTINATESKLDNTNFGPPGNVVAGMDDLGNAIAVWTQWNGTKGATYANHYTASTGQWSIAPIRIDSGGTSQIFKGADYAKLAVNKDGNAVAVWFEETSTTSFYANNYIAGSGWQGPTSLVSGSLGDALVPNVAIFPNGNAIAVWEEGSGTGGLQVVYRLYSSGVWQPEVVLASNGHSNYGPVVATGDNDEAVIAWGYVEASNSKISIYASKFDGNSSFLPGEKISVGLDTNNNTLSKGSYGADENAIVIDDNGVATIIWLESSTRKVHVSRTE